MTLAHLLCTLGIHRVADRRWNTLGWVGYCTRCGLKRTGLR